MMARFICVLIFTLVKLSESTPSANTGGDVREITTFGDVRETTTSDDVKETTASSNMRKTTVSADVRKTSTSEISEITSSENLRRTNTWNLDLITSQTVREIITSPPLTLLRQKDKNSKGNLCVEPPLITDDLSTTNCSAGNNRTTKNPKIRNFSFLHNFLLNIVGSCVAIFGLLGNGLSVCVLSTSMMKSCNSTTLIFLSFFDSLILLRHLLFLTMRHILKQFIDPGRLAGLYVVPVNAIFRPMEFIGHFGSIYTTVMLAAERFVAILFPFKAVTVCTTKSAKIGGFAILFVSIVYDLPRFFQGYLQIAYDPVDNYTKFVYFERNFSPQVSFFYNPVYMVYMEVVFLFILPAVALVILNTAILVTLWQKSRKLTSANSAVSGAKSEVVDKITRMTLLIIFTFCVTLLLFQMDRLFCWDSVGQFREGKPAACPTLTLTANVFYTFNSAVNFVYYCLFGARFRNGLKLLCCRKSPRQSSTRTKSTDANQV